MNGLVLKSYSCQKNRCHPALKKASLLTCLTAGLLWVQKHHLQIGTGGYWFLGFLAREV